MPRKEFKAKRRRKASFSFTGKSGVMLISGVLIVLISASIDNDDFISHFDQNDRLLPEILPDRMLCTLKHISDGDTVTASCAGYSLRIRLVGIDTPEMGQEPWGERSKLVLAGILPDVFTLQNHGQDIYQRTLGTLYADGKDINLQMIQSGMAVAYQGKATPRSYYEAEKQAKAAKLGIWSKAGIQQDPRLWRRYHN